MCIRDSYYLLQAEKVKDGVICYADGVEASEIAVLKLENEKYCKEAQKALEEYIQNRANVFAGYAPQQAAMVKEAVVAARGGYIAPVSYTHLRYLYRSYHHRPYLCIQHCSALLEALEELPG